jgi:hypothetical protein
VIKAIVKPGSEVVSILTALAIRQQNDRQFFVGTAAAIAATVVVGFSGAFSEPTSLISCTQLGLRRTERLPLIGHISAYAPYAILDIFVLCGILYDFLSRGRVNRGYIWGGLVIFIFPPAARMTFAVTVLQTDRCWRADLEGPRRGVRL